MEQQKPGRTCPACSSSDYSFRTRKKIEADLLKGEPEAWEVKFRCRACGAQASDDSKQGLAGPKFVWTTVV